MNKLLRFLIDISVVRFDPRSNIVIMLSGMTLYLILLLLVSVSFDPRFNIVDSIDNINMLSGLTLDRHNIEADDVIYKINQLIENPM